VPFDYKFQGTHMLRLSRLGEFADVVAVTEFDFWIDSSDSPSRVLNLIRTECGPPERPTPSPNH